MAHLLASDQTSFINFAGEPGCYEEVSSCDRRFFSPLETRVQPIQASPYVQDLQHITLHPFRFSRFSAMLISPLPFDAR